MQPPSSPNGTASRDVASGGASGVQPPHLKYVPPHFTFGPLAAAYIQYSIFKMWPPLLVFGPPLLSPGDGPDSAGTVHTY